MTDTPRRVIFPLHEHATLLDFAGSTQVFSAAGYECWWAAADMRPVITTEKVSVMPTHTFAQIDEQRSPLTVLFVPGGGPGFASVVQDKVYLDFLRSTAERATWAGAVCTGAFPAAAAGLLDGCHATTYWSVRGALELFPGVTVPKGFPRYKIQPKARRFTGGGVSSAIDLALELVRRIDGGKASRRTQLFIQYQPDPPFDAGDPRSAPKKLVREVKDDQEGFIDAYRGAVEEFLGGRGAGTGS